MNITGFNKMVSIKHFQEVDMFGEKLEDPKDYFKIDNSYVGKSSLKIRKDRSTPLKIIENSKQHFEKNRKSSLLSFYRLGSKFNVINTTEGDSLDITPPSDKRECREIKENEIVKLYEDVRNRQSLNKNKELEEKLPLIIKKRLDCQEKMLNLTQNYLKEENLVRKQIEKKIKRSQSDLLMNKSIEYRKKKEERESNSIDGNIERYYWILSLRKSKYSLNKNCTFLNVGLPHKPNFRFLSDSMINTQKEIIRNPAKTSESKALCFEGRKLIEEELEGLKKMKGKKFLFKDKEKKISQDRINHLKYESFKKSFVGNKEKR